jgi:CDGSH-type Zn-finger protein
LKQGTPRILPHPKGPYYLINDMEPKVVENIQNSDGKGLSTIRGVALCRCGASNNKPFCDGKHGIIRFSSENKFDSDYNNRIKNNKKNYVGKEITIHDNRRICSHAAECVNSLSSVFRLNSKPWIDPKAASVKEIIDTIRKCPSGALSYSIDGIEYRDQADRDPMITVLRDGPYFITCGIGLIGDNTQIAEGASKEHYTLCRCGASNNKPFCDGTHTQINFKDEKN